MCGEYDPRPEAQNNEPSRDCPDETVLLTVDDFYDLLMEQQEQM